MKPCLECGAVKPLGDFYRHPAMADGHVNVCKECQKAAIKANRAARAEQYAAYERTRLDDPKRKAARKRVRMARRADYRKAAADAEAKRQWNERNPNKRRVIVATGNAVRDGKLDRPAACERCGEAGEIAAYHEDFTDPLAVGWLCLPCHGWLRRRAA